MQDFSQVHIGRNVFRLFALYLNSFYNATFAYKLIFLFQWFIITFSSLLILQGHSKMWTNNVSMIRDVHYSKNHHASVIINFTTFIFEKRTFDYFKKIYKMRWKSQTFGSWSWPEALSRRNWCNYGREKKALEICWPPRGFQHSYFIFPRDLNYSLK